MTVDIGFESTRDQVLHDMNQACKVVQRLEVVGMA